MWGKCILGRKETADAKNLRKELERMRPVSEERKEMMSERLVGLDQLSQ